MSASQQTKVGTNSKQVLRIGIVQRGKIIEERELKNRETVSIGTSPKATFQVNSETLPRMFDLFEYDAGKYYLRFEDGMEGKIQLDDEKVEDFQALEKKGRVVQRGGKRAVVLSDKSRGKIIMGGEVTALFQFKPRNTPASTPSVSSGLGGSILDNIDTQFASILVLCAIVQVSVVAYARSLPYVEPTFEQIDKTYAKLIMPDKIPEPKKKKTSTIELPKKPSKEPEAEKVDEKKTDEKKVAEKKPESKPKPPPVKKPQPKKGDGGQGDGGKKSAADRVRGKGLLSVLGAKRAGKGGAIDDVFSNSSGKSRSLSKAFTGIKGVDIASSDSKGGRRGGSAKGEDIGIGGFETKGRSGKVAALKKKEKAVSGSMKEQTPEVDGALDRSKVDRVIKRKTPALKACYEQALKRNPGLKGKLIIRFEINTRGRTTSISFGGSLKSGQVESCIKKRVKTWRFPRPDGGSVFVDYPIVFTPRN